MSGVGLAGLTDLPAFVAAIAAHLDLDLAGAEPDAELAAELGLDSLAMIEILVLLENEGVVLPDDLIPELRTIGDLHHYAVALAPREPPVKPPSFLRRLTDTEVAP